MELRRAKVSLAIGLVILAILSVGVVSAETWVTGTVSQSLPGQAPPYQPLAGATVTAECSGCTAGPTTSAIDGSYAINLTSCESSSCGVGSQVNVTATKGSAVGSNSGVVDDMGTIDVALVCVLVEVPEFATIAIPAIAVLGLFLFFNKRKHKKD